MDNKSVPLSLLQLQVLQQALTGEGVFKIFLIIGIHLVFIYINTAMLFTLRKKPLFRSTARYIIFAHMLFNDTLHLSVILVMYVLGAFYIPIMKAACSLLVTLSVCTFTNGPLYLAVMSLERYTAVCFPLRHGELATPLRVQLAAGLVWAVGSVDLLIDLCVFFLAEPSFLLSSAVCSLEQLQTESWQPVKGTALKVLLLLTVATALAYTYVAIMLEARSASTGAGSARRALRTVLLHGFQLGLSLMSFMYVPLEALLAQLPAGVYKQMRYANFVLVLLLPRCLSSLVYGLRDKAFMAAFRQNFICHTVK